MQDLLSWPVAIALIAAMAVLGHRAWQNMRHDNPGKGEPGWKLVYILAGIICLIGLAEVIL